MATRSDFAQKLLNDLRARKERMVAAQSSGYSSRGAGGKYKLIIYGASAICIHVEIGLEMLDLKPQKSGKNDHLTRVVEMNAAGVYGKPSQNYKGSRQVKTLEYAGSRPANPKRRSSSGTRSLNLEESSQQLVLYGGGRNSGQTRDLTMAMAIALGNKGKLTKLESMGNSPILSFLQHIGSRSMGAGKMERSRRFDMNLPSSQFLNLSNIHIKEISKGAQKLNQILTACSNGLNFDRYSIEIGRELLKGAMDLEESLRMLVNLQEASEYIVSPQRKNRIRLLEEAEDDEDGTVVMAEQKQVARPKFSFDKPSRNSRSIKEVKKADHKQSLMALTTEAPTYPRKEALNNLNLVPHKRSASCGPDFRALAGLSETKKQTSLSQSQPEKGRISNVIAKLMGLEELPQKVDSKSMLKDSTSKKKEGTVSKKTAHASTKNVETKMRDTTAFIAIDKQVKQTNNLPLQDIPVTRTSNSELKGPDRKLPSKDFERSDITNIVSGSRMTSISMDKKPSNISQLHQYTRSPNNLLEKVNRQENAKHKEEVGIDREESKKRVLKDDVQKYRNHEAASMSGEKLMAMRVHRQKEIGNANRVPVSNPQKLQHAHGINQEQVHQKSEPQEERRQAEKREQQHEKQKLVRKQKETEAELKNQSKQMHDAMSSQKKQKHTNQAVPNRKGSKELTAERPLKGLPSSKSQENAVRNRSSTDSNANTRNSITETSDQSASLRERGSETDNRQRRIPVVKEEKHVHVPATRRKVDVTKVNTSETTRRINEVATKRNGTSHNSARPLKSQVSVLQEIKKRNLAKTSSSEGSEQMAGSRTNEAEVQNTMLKLSETSNTKMDGAPSLHKEAEKALTLNGSAEDELQSPAITQIPTPDESHPSLCLLEAMQSPEIAVELSTVHIGGQELELVSSNRHEQENQNTISTPLNGAGGGNNKISFLSQHEQKEISTPSMQEQLTDNETHLKQILIKSQIFLNTADALFKLNIPISILHITNYSSQEEDSKLVLDCAYEIMKRKGRKQELTLHPCQNISIISIKVIMSLNDLVKELNRDIEKLKFYGWNGSNEQDAADFLHKMLDRDIHNRDPDVNSMWELGWNEMMFWIIEKGELIREVEKHLLNGLIDEVTNDLLHLSVFVD
ncbi:LOW QUALITY PROTEIN: uncharacterized protein LOC127807639 [Diospyros lotus]|uniref:LOW QUALITY PROTEIN: uncharacterized protein LOC127807639 n=1 Tax=Diospyros lotus TaxID=55363 RepID=UPI002253EACD|nr:LOW QUALITY PROTEIN: uncharacterized protein LOC127807639 [Diospyros lotus]